MGLRVVRHPLVAHLLHGLRDARTPPDEFRRLARRLTTALVFEATTGLRQVADQVDTPLGTAETLRIAQPLVAVPILRAGLGMLDPVIDLFPDVRVGYLGLARDEATAIAHQYYSKLPDVKGALVLCLDPMLATGGSSSRCVSEIKHGLPDRVVMVSVVAAPEGVARLEADHPDVEIVTAALDSHLDERCYIFPGVGDFGDRLNGT